MTVETGSKCRAGEAERRAKAKLRHGTFVGIVAKGRREGGGGRSGQLS